jgi:hypothetical protein
MTRFVSRALLLIVKVADKPRSLPAALNTDAPHDRQISAPPLAMAAKAAPH